MTDELARIQARHPDIPQHTLFDITTQGGGRVNQ